MIVVHDDCLSKMFAAFPNPRLYDHSQNHELRLAVVVVCPAGVLFHWPSANEIISWPWLKRCVLINESQNYKIAMLTLV